MLSHDTLILCVAMWDVHITTTCSGSYVNNLLTSWKEPQKSPTCPIWDAHIKATCSGSYVDTLPILWKKPQKSPMCPMWDAHIKATCCGSYVEPPSSSHFVSRVSKEPYILSNELPKEPYQICPQKGLESRVFIENWKWVSKGCGSYLIHPDKPLAYTSL